MHGIVRVVLAGVWLAVGVGLLGRGALPPEWYAGKDAMTLNLMGLIAVVLAVYNVLRLVVHVRRQRARARVAANPLARPAALPPREREYNPDLDFTNTGPPADDKPPAT